MREARYAAGHIETRAASGPLTFVVSTSDVARDGMVIDADAWQLDNYRRNPVVLFGHKYFEPPIGRARDVRVSDGKLRATIEFDTRSELGARVDRLYRDGFMHAVSVGWATLEFEPAKAGAPPRITKADLLDISAVPVPADPSALLERERAGARALHAELARLGLAPIATGSGDLVASIRADLGRLVALAGGRR